MSRNRYSFRTDRDIVLQGIACTSLTLDINELYEIVFFLKKLVSESNIDLEKNRYIQSITYDHGCVIISLFCDYHIDKCELNTDYKNNDDFYIYSLIKECAFLSFSRYEFNCIQAPIKARTFKPVIHEGNGGIFFNYVEGRIYEKDIPYLQNSKYLTDDLGIKIEQKTYSIFEKLEPVLKAAIAEELSK